MESCFYTSFHSHKSLVPSATGPSVLPSSGDCAPHLQPELLGKVSCKRQGRCLQLLGLERIPRTQDLLEVLCCCSSPTTFHYRQVMLFLFLELYLFYFLNSHQRGGKKKEVLVHNDPNSDVRQAQQPPD